MVISAGAHGCLVVGPAVDQLQRQDANAHPVRAVDAFERRGDDRTDPCRAGGSSRGLSIRKRQSPCDQAGHVLGLGAVIRAGCVGPTAPEQGR